MSTPTESCSECGYEPWMTRKTLPADRAARCSKCGRAYEITPPDPAPAEARFTTDDIDIDRHANELVIFFGENGDRYVGVAPQGVKAVGRCVRIATSGQRVPGLANAIADAFRSIVANKERAVIKRPERRPARPAPTERGVCRALVDYPHDGAVSTVTGICGLELPCWRHPAPAESSDVVKGGPERCRRCGWQDGNRPTTCHNDGDHDMEPIPEAEWTPRQRERVAAQQSSPMREEDEGGFTAWINSDIFKSLDRDHAHMATWVKGREPLLAQISRLRSEMARRDEKLHKFIEAEHALSEAYLRLRKILNAYDTPHGPTRERVWQYVEQVALNLTSEISHLRPRVSTEGLRELRAALIKRIDYRWPRPLDWETEKWIGPDLDAIITKHFEGENK